MANTVEVTRVIDRLTVNKVTSQIVEVTSNKGSPGSVWRSGTAAPSASLGINGDYYLLTTNGDVYYKNSDTYSVISNIRGGGSVVALSYVIDNNGSELNSGFQGYLEIPFACTIEQITLLADVTGSIVVDIWKDTYANYPVTVADSIVASAKPTIVSGTKYQDSTLTGWNTTIAVGDILGFNIDSVTNITYILISLKVLKT